jgi:muramidase (phage lysozyme)
MDPTVPAPAARLLDFIRSVEAPRGYNTIFGNNQGKLSKPLTQMTVDQVLAAQPGWSRRFGSSAAGAYQFMQATLSGLRKELRLRGTQLFDASLQDRLGYHLLRRRGYDLFVAGKLPKTTFGLRLAQEWASFPVLAPVHGAHRPLTRGQSYYAGDRLNHALTTPERIEATLADVLVLAHAGPQPTPEPLPVPVPTTNPLPLPDPKSPFWSKTNIVAVVTPIFVWLAIKGLDFPEGTRDLIIGAIVTLGGALTTLFHSTASQPVAGSPLARDIRVAQRDAAVAEATAAATAGAEARIPPEEADPAPGVAPVDLASAPLEEVVEQLPDFIERLQRVARVAAVFSQNAAFPPKGPTTG